MSMRIETDSLGTLPIPENALYGIHSMRAAENFHITQEKLHPQLIKNLALIKKAAAITNWKNDDLSTTKMKAICQACDEISAGKWKDEFIVDAIQGGAGTSANMNVNEVIANRAIMILGGRKGNYQLIHPNDDVNKCQSTNDVFPTAGKMTLLDLIPRLLKELQQLDETFFQKSLEFQDYIKMGRTQLQDAVPLTYGRSFRAYQQVIHRDMKRLESCIEELRIINLGGTAIGTSINATKGFVTKIAAEWSLCFGSKLVQADDLVDATQNLDSFVAISGVLKGIAIDLSKISNDLRLLSSGPKTGIADLSLPARQAGSSIMPGKINPVIPEVVSQVAYHVIGNDVTITLAAEAGQLELNAFEPVLFYDLFASIEMLEGAVHTLTNHCIAGILVHQDKCQQDVENSMAIATAIAPYTGYQKAAAIVKKALHSNVPVRQILAETENISKERLDNLLASSFLADPLNKDNPVANAR